jgi:protein-S-isoprenylcysteine O-methyltransferase Ste14
MVKLKVITGTAVPVARRVLAALFIGLLLFLSAGSLHWWQAWIYLGVSVLAQIVTTLVVPQGLLAERTRRQHADQKRWDRLLYTAVGQIFARVIPIVAGLDFRFGWKPEIPVWLEAAALVFLVLGTSLFIWSMRVNAFFSRLVRLQGDRGHVVVSGGPYRYVRHPGYVALVINMLAGPLLLGSAWATLAGLVAAGLVVLRTALEDELLRRELAGYSGYAREVHWRLVPGVW